MDSRRTVTGTIDLIQINGLRWWQWWGIRSHMNLKVGTTGPDEVVNLDYKKRQG